MRLRCVETALKINRCSWRMVISSEKRISRIECVANLKQEGSALIYRLFRIAKLLQLQLVTQQAHHSLCAGTTTTVGPRPKTAKETVLVACAHVSLEREPVPAQHVGTVCVVMPRNSVRKPQRRGRCFRSGGGLNGSDKGDPCPDTQLHRAYTSV